MSKFLTQTKTCLPMVIQKSATDAVQILENHQNCLPSKVDAKVGAGMSLATNGSAVEAEKSTGQTKSTDILPTSPAQNLRMKSFLQAFVMDVTQVQGWLAVLANRGQTRLLGGDWTVYRARWVDGLPQLQEKQSSTPSSVSPEQLKKISASYVIPKPETSCKREEGTTQQSKKAATPENAEPETSTDKQDRVRYQKGKTEPQSPWKSNLLDAVVERAPEWQNTISLQLGALQEKVIQKLSKK